MVCRLRRLDLRWKRVQSLFRWYFWKACVFPPIQCEELQFLRKSCACFTLIWHVVGTVAFLLCTTAWCNSLASVFHNSARTNKIFNKMFCMQIKVANAIAIAPWLWVSWREVFHLHMWSSRATHGFPCHCLYTMQRRPWHCDWIYCSSLDWISVNSSEKILFLVFRNHLSFRMFVSHFNLSDSNYFPKYFSLHFTIPMNCTSAIQIKIIARNIKN